MINSEREKVNFEVFNAGGNVNNATKQMLIDEILQRVPSANVSYSENGSDPRNYRVTFEKVKTVLGFEPKYTVKDGVDELVDALEIGLYEDSVTNKNRYGNYKLNQTL